MKLNFAKRMSYIKASEIREILKVTEQEDVISFAGGLPAPELFPIDEINEINQIVLKEAGTKALQYTTTEGYAPLREWIANRMNGRLGTAFLKIHLPIPFSYRSNRLYTHSPNGKGIRRLGLPKNELFGATFNAPCTSSSVASPLSASLYPTILGVGVPI